MPTDPSAWLTLLSVPGLGPVTFTTLLQHFKTPENILSASFEGLCRIPLIGPETARSILQGRNPSWADKQIGRAADLGVQIFTLQDPAFPPLLRQIYAPPPVLFARGDPKVLQAPTVAIVGSRSFTPYGRETARGFAHSLACRGATIVSGLAMGIDTHAHRGALGAAGTTAAVLGSSLDHPYPLENLDLFHQICEQGLVLSEFPLGTTPLSHNFPRRNRIISGVSQGVLVVEAGHRSGALITAEHALEQNREVFAIPGPINSGKSRGTNRLIRQGATLVQTADDILAEIQPTLPPMSSGPQVANLNLSPEEQTVLKALSPDESHHIDRLSVLTGYSAPAVLSHLLSLELHHLVEQLPGKQFRRLLA